MYYSATSIALLLVGSIGCAALLILHQRGVIGGRARTLVLSALLSVVFVGHLGLFRTPEGGGVSVREPLPHIHEIYHYYLGTKYFGELGYAGLYEATILADFEDQPERFIPDARARGLSDNRLLDRAALLAASGRTRAAFDDERWSEFKSDLSLLRDVNPPDLWHARGYTVDHGYNATPFVTALLGGLGDQNLVEPGGFLGTIRILDPYLLVLVGVVVAALEGPVAALLFLLFLFANPMNEYAYIGGAYLRYNYLIALALALIALRQRWLVASGVFFAVAGWMRIFPLVFPALLLARDLAGSGWRERLRENAPAHVAFAIASVVILAGTSLIATPDGRNPWRAFAASIALHADSPSVNRIALEVPFSYTASKDRHREDGGSGDEWVVETREVFADRALPFRIAQLFLVVLALLQLRRGPPEEVLLPGMLMLFALTPLSHYYWTLLGLVPLAVRDSRRLFLLAILFVVMTLTAIPGFLSSVLDLCFTLFSLEVLLFLLVVAIPWSRAGRASLTACALMALACSPAEERLPVDASSPSVHSQMPTGDVYTSLALGISITKPEGWKFLPETSLPVDGERAKHRQEFWDVLDRPALIPIVTMTAPGAEDDGPMAHLRAVPLRPEDSAGGVQMMASLAPHNFIRQSLNPRMKHLDTKIAVEPVATKVGEHKAGEMVVSYGLRQDDGTAKPVMERIVHVRRGVLFIFLEMVAPEPVDESVAADFDRILASLQIDP